MNKSKIEWCTHTLNPIVGCKHGCPYCYAARIAQRFKQDFADIKFYPKRLEDLKRKKPAVIFMCSMSDMFGEWVPDEWIKRIFEVCEDNPQHRYLFLTKNPDRYIDLHKNGMLPADKNFWFGSTLTTPDDAFCWDDIHNCFVSIEPIHAPFPVIDNPIKKVEWVIIGAETGNSKDKVVPKREWIENIVKDCKATNTPVFLKNSLASIWQEALIQQFPWEDVMR